MKRKQLSMLIAASTALLVGASVSAAPPPVPGTKPPGGGPPSWAGPPEWAGGPTEPAECATPAISYCKWDDFLMELYAEWPDVVASEGVCTRYGGDVEFQIEVTYDCDDPIVVDGTFTLDVEIDLDSDPVEPFAYMCTAGTCVAMIEYADLFAHLDAAADAAADALCDGSHSNVSWDDWKEDPYPLFSVKQMNPGPGMGRQNRMKDYEDCVSSGY